jgi:hypothetical protein
MAWNRTKPGVGDNVESAPVRANFQALDAALWGKNLLANSEMNIWPEGSDTGANAVPAHFSKIGTPAISCVTGGKRAKFSAKLTYSGSGTDGLRQSLIPSHDGSFDGVSVSVAVWVSASSTGVTVGIEDGTDTTDSDAHSGGSTFELLTLTHIINAASTKLDFVAEITTSGNCEINQPTVIFGVIPPSDTIPSETAEGTLQWPVAGDIATGAVLNGRFNPWRPFKVIDGGIQVDTPPNATPVLVQIQKWTGAAWTNLYDTGTGAAIELATGDSFGSRRPNATSTLDSTGGADVSMFVRSFLGRAGSSGSITATGQANRKIRANIEQADDTSTAPAADGDILVRVIQYKRPLASYLRPQDES